MDQPQKQHPMIQFIDVWKNFDGNQVLAGLNLKVERGETKVIIGRSGVGKSVLLKHINRLLDPDHGKIIVDGQDIRELNDQDFNMLIMKIGMVFQGGALFDSLSVFKNISFLYDEYFPDTPAKKVADRVHECLDLVGLSGIDDKLPSSLSGGMKKRVALARAIRMKPEIILYDEPTTGLDPISADAINVLIESLHKKLRITSIVVTHDIKSAYRVADHIAMIYQGKIITEGTPDEIRDTRDPLVLQFITGAARGPITDGNGV